MREIKFRGKTQYKEWVEGSYLQTDDNTINPMQHRPLNLRHQIWSYWSGDWNMGGWDPMDVLPETVGQFTGLTDKNGKEIFEGDIYNMGDKNILYVVVWRDCGLIGKQLGSTSYAGVEYWKEKIEIIGNIHDNPELLK